MDYILNAKEMKNADKVTIEHFGIESPVLMERAAHAVMIEILRDEPALDANIVVAASCGNNGGDGIAIARMLKTKGFNPTIVLLGDIKCASVETKKQYKIAENYDLLISDDLSLISDADILVDAIFGIGLNRDIEGQFALAIDFFNDNKSAKKYAVDIPSGISADDGRILGCATLVDKTITFNFKKIGHLLYPGKEYCGQLIVKDVGITKHSLLDNVKCLSFEKEDLSLFPARKPDSHKGDCGKVFIIAGNETYGGAAYLAASAALHCGCGLVKIYTHINNRDFILKKLPEAVVETYEHNFDKDLLQKNLNWADSVVIGPGIGTEKRAQAMVDFVLKNAQTPVVVDADALNCISKDVSVLLNPHMDLILTPHLGEMSRLKNETVDYIKDNMLSIGRDFAMDNQVICVLKSATTITSIPYGETYINTTGNSGMSTAGSGDVLSGIIAALIGLGMKAKDAAPFGVYIHGLAGDYAKEDCGESFMVASDIIDSLMLIFMER